ncbi:hypothetical protein NC651_019916 [Populus alba x Populus x berolinensis]|nr:hypothetical protein NC651_019916 [Populus alba x Populus x berolinensis]
MFIHPTTLSNKFNHKPKKTIWHQVQDSKWCNM